MPERANFLYRLLDVLSPQIEKTAGSAIITVSMDQGEHLGGMTIGAKRNGLLEKATANFVAFVDDDDLLAPDYVKRILKAISDGKKAYTNGVDVIGIEGQKINIEKNRSTERLVQSMRYKTRTHCDGAWLSYPTHLNPVRLEIARKVGFPHRSFGEDGHYAARLIDHLKTEIHIGTPPIYFYEYRRNKTERIHPANQ